ncbi:superoxide dismutase [Dactylosporangium sp. NPDC050688]|uniref:superoxide dismutase n=1 Tax=Dactylosporangium sp. NPDC050688 TaxID=3157217 RepID=UPI0033F48CFA
MHRVTTLLLLLPVGLAGGCTPSAGGADPAPSPRVTSATGTFAAYTPGATAVTYDQALVPAGAVATVSIAQTSSDSRVWFTVAGLLPNRGYGVHLHTNPCGATGDAAGPHYRHRHQQVAPNPPSPPAVAPGPVSPSVPGQASKAVPQASSASVSVPAANPSDANPQNEVWLDVTTRADGRGSAVATHPWTFDPPPRSLVIHAAPTKTGPSDAGDAGARVACLTLPA